MTHFTNEGEGKQRVSFSAPYPGKIIALDLAEIGDEMICQRDSFLCAALGTHIDFSLTKKFGAGIFGGEGFILQKLTGDGRVFVHASGTVVKKELKGEEIRIDTGCIVAFTPGLEHDIKHFGNMRSLFFGGEGMFIASLKGT